MTTTDTNVMRYKKLRRSKREFPTRLIRGGGGHLSMGAAAARADIERELGISIEHLPKAHTRFQWRWKYPAHMSVCQANEFYSR